MPVGLSGRLKILQQSPLDDAPERLAPSSKGESVHLVPSRYNIRSSADDGRLIVWNSLRGTMNEFKPAQRAAIERLLSQKGFTSRLKGVVKYLHDRGFLVREGTNEYRQIQMAFGQQHYRSDTLELILLASEDCNFRCTYCYEDFARGTMQPWVRTGVKNLLRSRLSGLRNLSVSWFGGEPLYGFPALEELAPFFVDTAREHGLRFASSMTTNGYLMTPEVAEKLLAWNIRKYQITIDGMGEDHDRNRPTRDGQSSFGTILSNLVSLKERPDKYLVDIRVNYDPNNVPRLDEFLCLIEGHFGGDQRFRLRFRQVGRWGGPNDENFDVCGISDSKRIYQELRQTSLEKGLHLSDPIGEIKGPGARVCYAARPYNFIIGADGKVMKCTIDLDKQDRNVVGHLAEDGRLTLDREKMALWTEPAFEADSKCQKCVVLPTCQGISCPIVRLDDNKSPCIPLRTNAKKELREVLQYGSGRLQVADGP